jgi:hypothetical protein
MGILGEPLQDPESPPPSWSPAKHDIWRKPSKIQICMPRLKFAAKVVLSIILLIVLFKIIGQPPPPPPTPAPPTPESPGDEFKERTEEEMQEWAKREQWVWKDFRLYVIESFRDRPSADTFRTVIKALSAAPRI